MDVAKHYSGHGFGRNKFYPKNIGFTLIELLISLSIISILSLSVTPTLSAIIAKDRTAVLTNSIAGALALSRSFAVNHHATVITCQSNNGLQCNKSGDWHNGFITFVDTNKNKQKDADEKLLQVVKGVENNTLANFKGSAGIKHYIKYKPTGQAHPNGSFLTCNPNVGTGNALIMTHSGRLRLSKKQTDRSAITC